MNPTTDVFEQRIAAHRGRHRRAGRLVRTVRDHPGPARHHPGRRRDRLGQQPLRRHLPALPLHVAEARPHREVRGLPQTRRPSAGHHAQDARGLCRDDRQPEARRARFRGDCRRSPTTPACRWSWTTRSASASCGPFEHGADIVVASATKYIGGHGTSIGGVIVDSRQVRLEQRQVPRVHRARPELPRAQVLGRVRQLSGPGQRRLHHQGPRAAAARPRPCAEPVQLVPLSPGPGDPPLRQRQHSENALEVARFLKAHPLVSWVTYPGAAR